MWMRMREKVRVIIPAVMDIALSVRRDASAISRPQLLCAKSERLVAGVPAGHNEEKMYERGEEYVEH
jgi:hypothetical protein